MSAPGTPPGILIVRSRVDPADLRRLVYIRPAQGNPSMEIQDAGARDAVREIVHALVGKGDPL